MKQGWEYKKLGEVCYPKNKIQRATKCFDTSDKIFYIDISSIDNTIQKMSDVISVTFGDAPSRAQQKVEYGDIIVSTVRPNLKNIAIIDRYESNLVASSGFCVLRNTEHVERNYLFHYITSDLFTQHLMKLTTGANYPAVRDQDVRDSIIPIPPKSTQLSIVSELDKINELIRLKKEQLKDYDNLAQSIFYEMFGDPVENEKGWEVKKLSSLFKVSSSKRIMQEEWTKEGVPFLKVSDIVSLIKHGKVSPSTFISKLKFKKLEEAKMVPTVGDILITSRGTLGLCYIIKTDDKFYFQDGMVTWLSENTGDIIPIYITYVFSNNHFLEVLAGRANKSTVSYISIKQISKKEITVPPLPLQHLFAQRIEQIERQKSAVQKSITDLETLLASRMQYWFE